MYNFILKSLSFSIFLFSFVFCSGDDSKMSTIIEPTKLETFQFEKLTKSIYIIKSEYRQPTNISLLVGDDGNLLIDTGYPDKSNKLNATIKSISDKKLLKIINTHDHYDHFGGNSLIDENGNIYANENGINEIQSATPEKSLTTIHNNDTFEFNNEVFEFITFEDNGHTKADAMIYLKNSNVLFTGDQYLSESFPSVNFSRGATVQNNFKNLETIINKFNDDTKLVPGHGKATSIGELKVYLKTMKETVDIIRDKMKTMSLSQIIDSNPLENYKSFGEYLAGEGLTSEYWIGSIYYSYQNSSN